MKSFILSLSLLLSVCFGFAQNPGEVPKSYYVNDNSTQDDTYSSAVGNDGNPGTQALPFATVNRAISAAAEGDNIFIDAGTYAQIVFIGKSVNLVGAGADLVKFVWPVTVDPIFVFEGIPYYAQFDSYNGANNNPGKPANIINISGITIDGQNRVFNEKSYVNGIRFHNAGGTVANCVFTNFQNPGIADPTFKIDRAAYFQADKDSPAQVNFNNNSISDFSSLGLVGAGAGISLYASGNTITGNGVATKRQYGISAEFIKVANIEGNTISNMSNYYSQGNQNDMSFAVSVYGNATASTIKNNIVSNSPGGLLSTNTNITIEGNELTTPHSYGIALQADGVSFTASVLSNKIIGSQFAVIAGSYNGAKSTVNLQQNSITNSVVKSIYNFNGNSMTATCNWMGSTSSTVVNASTFGGIKIYSLLASETDVSPDVRGFQSGTTHCIATPVSFYVNDNSLSGDKFTAAIGNDNNPGTIEAPFATVGKALREALSGDNVYIDAGTYAEKVFFAKSSNLIGAGASLVKFVWPASVQPNYYVPDNNGVQVPWYNQFDSYNGGGNNPAITINLSGITIDGENRVFNQSAVVNGVKFHNTSGTIVDCVFKNFKNLGAANPALKTDRAVFFLADAASSSEINFINNRIEDFYTSGLFASGAGLTLNAKGNEIIGNGINTVRQRGIFINTIKTATIEGNTISNISRYNDATTGNRSYAVSAVGIANPSLFKNNLVLNSNAGFLLTDCNLTIEGNEMITPQLFGFYLQGTAGTSNTTFISNKISGSNVAIYSATFYGAVLNLNLQENSISNAADNTFINYGANINTTCNWFGTVEAGTIYSTIKGELTINSLLASGEDALPNTRGFQKGDISCTTVTASNYYVNDNIVAAGDLTNAIGNDNNPGTMGFPLATVKRAMQLAMPGSTILVDAGDYTEQVIVKRPMTIRGAGRDKTIFHLPTNMALNYQTFGVDVTYDNYAIFHAQDANGVTIQNIAVDGDNEKFDKGILYGIALQRSSGVVSGCEIRHFKNNNPNNQAFSTGSGIIGLNYTQAATNIEVYDNIVKDFYYSGIIIAGEKVTYQVHDNIIQGNVNELKGIFQNGIEIYASAGSVKNNSISNITTSTDIEGKPSAAISVEGSTNGGAAEITGNRINTAASGIIAGNGNHIIKNNEISGSLVYGIGSYLGETTNAVLTIENNTIANNNTGLYFINFGTGNLTAELHKNSFTGSTIKSIENVNATVNATCNWFGATNLSTIAPYIQGAVNFTPWLTEGVDTDLGTVGFQPKDGTCTGKPFSLSFVSKTDVVKCGEDKTGAINVMIESGGGPLTIQWTKQEDPNFSASTEDLHNIGKGVYDLVVTDENDESLNLQVEIDGPVILTGRVFFEPIYCTGQTSQQLQVLTSGGKAFPTGNPYSISWSDGSTDADRTGVSAGTYSVTVTDANGCVYKENNVLITDPAPIVPSISFTNVLCNGGATGTALVSAKGGTLGVLDDFSTYTYLWSNGETSTNISGLSVGTYSVTVEDDYGCTGTTSITITEPAALRALTQVTNVRCYGQSNGSVSINANGGTPPYTYSIDNGAVGSSNLFGSLAIGNHTVKVVDNNNCEVTTSFTVGQPTPIVISTPVVVPSCSGSATGSISLTASGGAGNNLGYSWTGPNGFTAAKASITGLAAGNYTLIVTDANGCTTIPLDVNVGIAPAILVSGTAAEVLCFGGSTGSIILTAPAITTGITYAWTGPNNYKSTARDIFALKAGTYTVTVKVGACSYVQSFEVKQPAAALAMTLSKTDITSCDGLGSITATTTGGSAPYQYSLNNASFPSTGAFTGLKAGTYTVKVVDAKGCSLSSSITIADSGNDPYEANNKQTVATSYVMNSSINARIAPTATDIDWYKFTTKATPVPTYTVTLSHPSTQYAFDLYDSRARLVSPTSITSGLTATKTYSNLVAGAVYSLRIQGSLSFLCYQMRISDGTVLPAANPINNTLATSANGITKPSVVPVQLEASVAPNPHPGQFNLNVNSPVNGMAKVELVSVSGQVINQQQVALKKGSNTIRYAHINSGMLIYRVTINDLQTTGRIIGIK